MSQDVFVDTSAWYALADSGDTHHSSAVRCVRGLLDERRTLATTNYVASETYTLLRVRLGFVASQEFLRRIRGSAFAQRVFVPEPWEEAAEDLLSRYDDQDLSYVDATSFVTMRRLGIQEAFAFDHHFAILGFTLVVPA
ncbi:MAG TPA: type II toxin-antitoxin system VapC family toxin [Chloroflexota bacterium]|nr:type II toxin-antitoxin system VapC family toxin [Chloroflexota bacterium]